LSEDGRVAFFTTAEPLVADDHNTSLDAYEWREGRLGLISSGTGREEDEVLFFGASRDGSTAFFRTAETLVPMDRDDGEGDVYAARVGGGFAEAAAPPTECQAACLPSGSARLSRPRPISAQRAGERAGLRLLKVVRRTGRGGDTGTRLAVLLTVPAAGRVSVVGTEAGAGGKRIVEGHKRVAEAGRARIPLHPSRALARTLAQGDSVEVRLVIRVGTLRLVRTVTLTGGPG
jgi:hypothetical protein